MRACRAGGSLSRLLLSHSLSLPFPALQLLVSKRITGLPVVDGDGRVVSRRGREGIARERGEGARRVGGHGGTKTDRRPPLALNPSNLPSHPPPQIGVVSDFDLLSLDVPDIAPAGMFPALGGDWDAFFSSKEAALKGVSKT